VEEYTSIMKNDVWDIVPRLEGKAVVRSSGFTSYLQDFLIRSWTSQSFTMIIKVVSNSLRIQCFMTSLSI
jgi:hypothetical protein